MACLSWCFWGGGKDKEPASKGSSLNSSTEWGLGLREVENVKFPSVRREERRIDKEYDAVLVPSDGVCLSGSESDEPDWSIGWTEPLASDFQSDVESDDGFAVLVPCYKHDGRELEGPNVQFLNAIENLQNQYADGKWIVELWLSGSPSLVSSVVNH